MRLLKFALIYNNEIKNIFDCENYERANFMARASLGDEAFAINVSNYESAIGDKYENGIFYHKDDNGNYEEAKYILSAEDKIEELTELIMTLYKEMETK